MPPPRMNESMECGTGDNEIVPRRARPTGGSYPLVSLRRNQWSVCSGIRMRFLTGIMKDLEDAESAMKKATAL